MERIDVNDADRFAQAVTAAERGEDVEVTRDGRVVAHLVTACDRLVVQVEQLRSRLPAAARAIDWSSAVGDMRHTS